MSTGPLGEQWPFNVKNDLLLETTYDPNAGPVVSSFCGPAAGVLDTDPRTLPPLNERVDPEYVDTFVDGGTSGSPEDVRVALEISLEGIAVLLCDDGRVRVYPDEQKPHQLDSSATVEHDWSSPENLLWSIGRAIAAEFDEDPIDVGERLIKQLNVNALDRLLRPRSDGTERSNSRLLLSVYGYEVIVGPDGAITVEPSLAVLKRSGAALLVVGSLPEQGFDRAVSTLLGEPEEARSPLFLLHGQDLNTASRRLSMAGIAPSAATIVEHRAHARAASTETVKHTQPGGTTQPKVVSVSDDIQALPEVVRETIEDDRSIALGELRLSVDSLSSMVDSTDLETAIGVIEPLCHLIRTHQGVGTFLLPVDADSDLVEALAPLFDTVVEVRPGDGNVEQRWWLTGTGHRTVWFPLR